MPFCRPFEEPAEEADVPPQGDAAADKDRARKRKATSKGAANKADREREPAMATRAEQLLAAAELNAAGDQGAAPSEGHELL